MFVLGVAALLLANLTATAQSKDPQPTPKLSSEQQKQLEQLQELEARLQKDREAVHAAIDQFGFDSDETDQAEEQLFRDREAYRNLRRALRAAGVPLPSPMGYGPGREARNYGRHCGCERRGHHGRHHGQPMDRCPCEGW